MDMRMETEVRRRMVTGLRMIPPLGTIAISLWFLFWNPYSGTPPQSGTAWSVMLLLVLPAVVAIAAMLFHMPRLRIAAFFWSLPLALYLGLAGLPSWWTLLWLTVGLYLVPGPARQHES